MTIRESYKNTPNDLIVRFFKRDQLINLLNTLTPYKNTGGSQIINMVDTVMIFTDRENLVIVKAYCEDEDLYALITKGDKAETFNMFFGC